MFVLLSLQIKHSLHIPYEMYLLRFGRGGRQVLGYINSGGPALTQMERRDEVSPITGNQENACCIHNKSSKRNDAGTWEKIYGNNTNSKIISRIHLSSLILCFNRNVFYYMLIFGFI